MIKKILSYFISILIGIGFILTLIIILLGIKANTNNNIVQIFGYSYSVVATNSMEPTIEVGEIIITKRVDIEDVEIGDVIVFYSDNYQIYIVHRVIDKSDGNLITKGDNPKASVDPDPVSADNFHGLVRKHGKFLNIGKLILDYKDVVYLLIICLFIYIIISEIVSIIMNIKKAKEEEFKKNLEERKQKVYEKEKARLKEMLEEEQRDS